MKKKFNFPVVVYGAHQRTILSKREPIFCFKDDSLYSDSRYCQWIDRCQKEREANQRPVSAKERAESTLLNPSDGRQPQ